MNESNNYQRNSGLTEAIIDHIIEVSQRCIPMLESQIQYLQKKPKIRTAGHLVKTSAKGKPQWRYVLTAEESKSGKREISYIKKSEQSLLHQLALKLFIECSLRVKKGQLKALKTLVHRLQGSDRYSRRVISDPDLRDLLGLNPPLQEQLQNWAKQDYPKNTKHPETLKIPAHGGITVRSKSEAVIVSELQKLHIPFRYECGIPFRETIIYPDFTIRHPVTGQLFLWEHFGMMDDPSYISNAAEKIEIYAQLGYVHGINLITTSETRNHPLDYRLVRTLILYYFQLS